MQRTLRTNWHGSSRRTVALLAVVSLAVAVLASCSRGSPSDGGTESATSAGAATQGVDEGKAITITYWGRNSESTANLVEEFNAAQAAIKVELTQVPDDQFITKIGAAVRSGSAPDVLAFDDVNGPLFAATGVLLDITDRIDALPYKDALNPAQLELGTYGGASYAVPKNSGISLLLWNKDLYRQAGLDPDTAPSNWADIETAAKAIRALGDDIYGWNIPGACGGCLAFSAAPLIWASGGDILTAPGPDQTTTYSTDPAVAAALEFERRLWEAGVVPAADQSQDGSTQKDAFLTGKVGLILGWPELILEARDAGLHVGYAPTPGQNGGFATFAGGDDIGIVAGSKNADAGWEFIEWLLSEDAQLSALRTNYVTPVRSDILTDEIRTEYPEIAVAVEAGTQGGAPVSIAANALMLAADSPWLVAFQRVVFGGEDVDQVLKDADAASATIINQAYQEIGQS